MDLTRKRNLFLAITVVLVVAIVAVSAVILVRGPRESSVELVSNNGDGTATVNDINDGNMTIPYYDINVNTYKLQDFKAGSNGTIVYEGGDSFVGINVNSQMGAIDWAQVKQSGVDFALIRVGAGGARPTATLCWTATFRPTYRALWRRKSLWGCTSTPRPSPPRRPRPRPPSCWSKSATTR